MKITASQSMTGEHMVSVEAEELDCGSRKLPYAFTIGHYNPTLGVFSHWTPAGYKPRGYAKAAKQALADALEAHQNAHGLTFYQWLQAADRQYSEGPLFRRLWITGAEPREHALRNHPGGLTFAEWCERAKLPLTSGYARKAWTCGEDPLRHVHGNGTLPR